MRKQEVVNALARHQMRTVLTLARVGPAHASEAVATLQVYDTHGRLFTWQRGVAPKDTEAVRIAYAQIMPLLPQEPPHMRWTSFASSLMSTNHVVAFKPPPTKWFAKASVLGVDFEGTSKDQLPQLVQIACEEGVVVARMSDAWVKTILADARHTHVVFGADDMASMYTTDMAWRIPATCRPKCTRTLRRTAPGRSCARVGVWRTSRCLRTVWPSASACCLACRWRRTRTRRPCGARPIGRER